MQGIGPRSARTAAQADAQPRQVLNPPSPRERMPQTNPDQVDQAQPMRLRVRSDSRLIRMFEAFRSRWESDRSWSERTSSRQRRRSGCGSAHGGARRTDAAGPRCT